MVRRPPRRRVGRRSPSRLRRQLPRQSSRSEPRTKRSRRSFRRRVQRCRAARRRAILWIATTIRRCPEPTGTSGRGIRCREACPTTTSSRSIRRPAHRSNPIASSGRWSIATRARVSRRTTTPAPTSATCLGLDSKGSRRRSSPGRSSPRVALGSMLSVPNLVSRSPSEGS